MGADDDVHLAGGKSRHHPAGFGGGEEPAEHLHPDRVGLEALGEGLEVLLHQERRRAKYGHLGIVRDGLERCPQRHLGLPEPDITEDEPVHRGCGLHVLLHVFDGRELVAGLLVGEGILHLPAARGYPARKRVPRP